MATITNLSFAINSSWNGNGVKQARADLKLLNEDLRRVQNTRIRINVDMDDSAARRKMDKFKEDAKFMEANVRLDADTAKAEAEIARVTRDRHMNVFVDDNGFADEIDSISRRIQQTDDHTKVFGSNASMAMRLAKIGAVAFGASLVVLPGIIQTVGAAITVGLGGAFVGAAALFHKENQKLKDEAGNLKEVFLQNGRAASEGLIQPMIDGMATLRGRIAELTPAFKAAFDAAGVAIQPFVNGVADLVQNAMPGVVASLQNISPVMDGLRSGLANFGSEMSRMFLGMSVGAEGMGQALNVTFTQIGVLMANFGVAAGQMASTGAKLWDGFLDGFNRFLKGYLDGMVLMLDGGNAEKFAQFWRDLGDGVGGFLREALPGIASMGATFSTVWGPALRDILPPLGSIIGSLATGLKPVIEAMAPILQIIADGLRVFADWLAKNETAATVLATALAALWLVMHTNPVVAIIVGLTLLVSWLIDLEQKTGMFSRAWNNMIESFRSGGGIFESIRGWIGSVVEVGQKLWDLFGTQLANAWQSIKENASSAFSSLSESFRGLKDTLGPLWEQLKPILEFLWNAIKVIAAVVAGDLLLAIKAFGGAILGGLGPAIRMFGEIISEVVQVVKGLIQWVTGILQVFRGTFNAVTSIVRIFAGLFTGNMDAVKNAFGDLGRAFQTIGSGILNMFKGVWTAVTAIWDSVVAIFRGAWGIVSGMVKGFVDGVVGFFQWLWDILVGHSIVPDLLTAIFDWFMWLPTKILQIAKDFVGWVVERFQWLWNTMRAIWDAYWSAWSAGFQMAWSWARDLVAGIWQWIQDRWDSFWATVRAIWDGFKIAFEAVWNGFWSWARDFVSGIWNWIKQRWDDFWAGVRIIWDNFRTWMTDMWNTFWNWVRDFVGQVWDGIVGKFEEIKDKVTGIIQGLVDKVRDIWNGITGIFEKPVEAIKGIFNGIAGPLGLPTLAMGGAVANSGPGPAASHHAIGGQVRGPGTSTSDSIPAYLSDGEHVLTAKEVDAFGGHDAVYSMRRELMAGRNGHSSNAPAYANGGPVEWMWARVQELQPSMQLTSSYRPSNDHHGSGKAIDVSNGTDTTPQMEMLTQQVHDAWGRDTLELIHQPSMFNIKNGSNVGDGMGLYGAATMGQHRNHVHWAVDRALDARSGAAVPGGGGAAFAMLSEADRKKADDAIARMKVIITDSVKSSATLTAAGINRSAQEAKTGQPFIGPVISTEVTDAALDYVASQSFSQKTNAAGTWNPAGDVAQMGTIMNAAKAIRNIKAKKDAMMAMGAIGGVIPEGERRKIIEQAMQVTNTPPPSTRDAWLAGMNTLITRESNWNAGARNDWDSNAAAGNNSVGLAQVIPTTFQAHKAPGYNNIYGPVDNVAASINYIKSRYGSIENVQQANANMPPKGYAGGTAAARSGWAMVGENGPEMVKFRGGEQVYSFDEIVEKLKDAATEEGRQVSLGVVHELRKLIEQNRTQAVKQTDTMVDLVERLIRENTGHHIEIPVTGGNTEDVIQQILSRVIPELEMALRQGVGRR